MLGILKLITFWIILEASILTNVHVVSSSTTKSSDIRFKSKMKSLKHRHRRASLPALPVFNKKPLWMSMFGRKFSDPNVCLPYFDNEALQLCVVPGYVLPFRSFCSIELQLVFLKKRWLQNNMIVFLFTVSGIDETCQSFGAGIKCSNSKCLHYKQNTQIMFP